MDYQLPTKGYMWLKAPEYIRSFPGILKVIQAVLSAVAFGCSTAVAAKTEYGSGQAGFGWCSFVPIAGFLQALVCLFVHMRMSTRWNWPRILELLSYIFLSLCFLSAGIVAAVMHSNQAYTRSRIYYYDYGGYWRDYYEYFSLASVGAAATAFLFLSTIAWAMDTGIQITKVRISVTFVKPKAVPTFVNNDLPQRFEGKPQY